MHDSIERCFAGWRLVFENIATLGEIDGEHATYNFSDIMRANAILDYKADMQKIQQQKQEKQNANR